MAETEKDSVVSHAMSLRASVDFPAPEGEERMIKRPRRVMDLLNVLHLLAHLVDGRLEVKPDPGEGLKARLGTHRVGLAVEFLHQKVELAPHQTALPDQFSRRISPR